MAKEYYVVKLRNQDVYKIYEGEQRAFVGLVEASEKTILGLDISKVKITDKGTAKDFNQGKKVKGYVDGKHEVKPVLEKVKDYAQKVSELKKSKK